MRSTVFAALAGATLIAGASGTAAAEYGFPTGTSGSAGGVATTGSSGTGSSGEALAAFEKILFNGPLLCAAVGSAINANVTCPGTAGPVIP
ncbi:hypothetical protein [Nocardia australiensis]|uniref:hypothetical protein n=1 Tax=Nocardia australiensis TaxID=2887191 RepID=UPI001D143058|nr:hypothetical protein [Nocardia australiensis]